MKNNEQFRPVVSKFDINEDRYFVSAKGVITDNYENTIVEPYHSTNGHDYIIMKMNSGECCIDLVENIVATSFGMITPAKMVNDSIIISHINGDSLDNSIENLVVMKDEEIFRDVGLIGFANNLWFVSNHGNVYGNRYKKILKTQSAFSKK